MDVPGFLEADCSPRNEAAGFAITCLILGAVAPLGAGSEVLPSALTVGGGLAEETEGFLAMVGNFFSATTVGFFAGGAPDEGPSRSLLTPGAVSALTGGEAALEGFVPSGFAMLFSSVAFRFVAAATLSTIFCASDLIASFPLFCNCLSTLFNFVFSTTASSSEMQRVVNCGG
jgi:hypothetical protein